MLVMCEMRIRISDILIPDAAKRLQHPYVKVSLVGERASMSYAYCTRAITDNDDHPTWNDGITLQVLSLLSLCSLSLSLSLSWKN